MCFVMSYVKPTRSVGMFTFIQAPTVYAFRMAQDLMSGQGFRLPRRSSPRWLGSSQ